jgi:CubicO group peptidase (beta-lactamase class C family)
MALIVSAMIAQGQATGESNQPGPIGIGASLEPLVANHTLAGAVILVATRDRILTVNAVGYRDIGAKAPMAANDMFWIASVTKPLTATAFMMLVDEGKVSLDDPVEKYLPEFKGQMVRVKQPQGSPASSEGSPASTEKPVAADHPIRIREILSHTSGLPFKSSAQPGALDMLPLKEAVRSYAAEPLLFQPGTSSSYSNEGLNTAARILEVVSGVPYEQFIQQRLLDPLGMKDTTFWPNAEQISRLAKSYKADAAAKDLREVPINQLTYPLDDRTRRYAMPAGGLFSTAQDLAKFCQMILNGGKSNGKRYISEQALHAMTSRQNSGFGGSDYGFGWGISKNGLGHGGAFNNDMEIDRTDGRIFIFMVQQDGPWGTADGAKMVDSLKLLAKGIQ